MDEYVLREKEAISQSAANHTATIRNLNADKEETEQRIELERNKEREMLDSEWKRVGVCTVGTSCCYWWW